MIIKRNSDRKIIDFYVRKKARKSQGLSFNLCHNGR